MSAHQIGHPAPPEVCVHIIKCLSVVIISPRSPPPHSPDNITTHITPALAPGRLGSIHSLTAQLCPEFLLLAVKFHESGKMTTTSVAMLAACSEWRLERAALIRAGAVGEEEKLVQIMI